MDQSFGQVKSNFPLRFLLQRQNTKELWMKLLNVCGCREYLESLGSRQRLLQSSIFLKTIVPFLYQLIKYWGSEPNTLRSICTTSEDLCMMGSLICNISLHLSKLRTYSPKYFQRGISAILSLYLGYLIMCEDRLNTIFHIVLFMSMFEGGFSYLWFCHFFLVLYGQVVCKRWLSLVSRPFISDIFWYCT